MSIYLDALGCARHRRLRGTLTWPPSGRFLELAGLRSILRADSYCKKHEIRLTVVKPRGFASRVFTLTRAHRELDLVDPRAPGWSGPAETALVPLGHAMQSRPV